MQASRNSTHLDVLPDPALQLQMVEYWSITLCDLSLPIPGFYNPLREIFTPIAFRGALAASDTSTAAVAVFHLICTASAICLSRSKRKKSISSSSSGEASTPRLAHLALTHHNLALVHLRRNLLSARPDQYVDVLAALTLCIINETIVGSNPSLRVHIDGACHWVRSIEPSFWEQSKPASQIYQMFAGLAILSLSPLVLDGDSDAAKTLIEFHHPEELYFLDLHLGIAYPTLKAISALNKMRIQQQSPLPAAHLDRLETELLLSVPQVSISDASDDQKFLVYHLTMSFYYAVLILFKRTIRKVPVVQVQSLVSKSLEHLEALVRRKHLDFSPTIWPVAISALEAGEPALQRRFLEWLDFFWLKTEFEVWREVETLAKRIWEARADGAESKDIQWQDFVRRVPELRIMMI